MLARVLITGGTGLLGLNWAASIKDNHDVTIGVHNRFIKLPGIVTQRISLDSVDSFVECLTHINPDYVVHAAGLASIELCEENPDLAYHINVELAENVARACAHRGIRLAHISTDHLFRGNQAFLVESASVDPINIYGKTKAEAELRVQAVCPDALLIRTNFYGWGPSYRQSFSDWVLKNLKMGYPITLFDDVFYTPVYIGRLALIVHKLFKISAAGVFNIVGDERLSKHEFALRLADIFDLDPNLISSASIRSRNDLVLRPKEMSLSNKKVCEELSIKVGGINEHLLLMKHDRLREIHSI